MKLCQWCNEKPVKLAKNNTCSRSCGSALRYQQMKIAGKLVNFKAREQAAKKTRMSIRLQKEIVAVCERLKIEVTKEIRVLYITARNIGYHNGFFTRDKRARMEK